MNYCFPPEELDGSLSQDEDHMEIRSPILLQGSTTKDAQVENVNAPLPFPMRKDEDRLGKDVEK
jgi:hypothetical protein